MEVLPESGTEIPAPSTPGSVAPAWHTVILIAGIAFLSWQGARELGGGNVVGAGSGFGGITNVYAIYASTVISQILMVAWVFFGVRLRKVPFRSLFGNFSGGWVGLLTDFGIAAGFWLASVITLATLNLTWLITDAAMHHRSLIGAHGKPAPADPAQQQLLHTLSSLAPSNGREVLAWALVCIMAGLVEELVFRGYFQRQFTAWGRGAAVVGVVASSLLFGAAHGYQGIHNMIFLSLFGAMFSMLVLFRRSLRPGIFAHAWNDFAMGLLLMAAKARHLL
jgi:membrane protease YdiL (CAAX protease family)